ncbi:MAG: two-component system sensor histidine kinase NtrB [Verrucomicrobiales bacterium]
MDAKTRLRFSELVVAIVIVVFALIWAERMAWNQISALRRENHAFIEKLQTEDSAEAQKFLSRANASLVQLQRFIFVALLCLLGSGATLIALAYRRMIAPLRTTLTESKAIIERQEKLASLGVFATGIAHEIRNPLTAIKVRLFSLKQSHHPGASEHEDLQVIGAEIDRLELIVKDFLQFARPSDPELRKMAIGPLLREIHGLLQKEFSDKGIHLETKIEGDGMAMIDSNKFKQVLLNFIRNGGEALEGTGTVTLRSWVASRILGGVLRPAVVIDIKDTGAGMPPEVQKRLFDPFFTTKEQGTGLGLPIAARIIEKHGGAIEYVSSPGQGTTFSIILPRIEEHETES